MDEQSSENNRDTGSNSYVVTQIVNEGEHAWLPQSSRPISRPVSERLPYTVQSSRPISSPVSEKLAYTVQSYRPISSPVSEKLAYTVQSSRPASVSASEWLQNNVPSPRFIGRPVSSQTAYNVIREPLTTKDGEFTIMTEVIDDDQLDAYPWNNYHLKSSSLPPMKATPIARAYPGIQQRAFVRHVNSFQNGRIKKQFFEETADDGDDKKYTRGMAFLEGKNGPIVLACFVRFLLIAHNILTVWRVTDSYEDNMYWLLVIANFLLILEGMVVITRRAGLEYSWWTPCFLIYLASTIPAIWLLQLNQYDRFKNPSKWTTTVTPLPVTATSSTPVTNVTVNGTDVPIQNTTFVTDMLNFTTINTTITTTPVPDEPVFGTLNNDVWVIIVEESLVYLLVFSRWLLPRGEVSRDFLADLLLEFLAIASDIMELLAVFDEEDVRSNLKLTYVILAVWSASFIQFIPIFMQKKRFRRARSPNVEFLTRHCGDKFIEIVVTCMSIFLQDLPFLVVRLYIIIEVNLITYSLIFFLLKNIVTLMLLFYRLGILCYRLPHCKGKPA